MQILLDKLLREIAESKDVEAREDMMTQLGYILERSNIRRNKAEYPLILTSEQMDINLTLQEQHEIFDYIMPILHSTKDAHLAGGLIWAIGKANPNIVIRLQDFLLENYTTLDDGVIYLGILAFGTCFVDERSQDYKKIISILRFAELERMYIYLSKSENADLSKQASSYIDTIHWYREQQSIGNK